MGLLNFLVPTQTIITEDEIIVMKGSKIIFRERKHHHPEHHHHHTTKLIVSSVALFDQSNPNLIISKTQGEIMADKFGRKQGVVYTLAPQKDDQSTGAIDLATLAATVDNTSAVTVVPDPANPLTGKILGVDSGDPIGGTAVVTWTALSLVGRKSVTGTVTVTIGDTTPPDTSGDATSLGVTLGDVFNQDGSPVV